MESTDKTLTQLANELNVSRDKIIYRYKKLPEEDYYKESNTIYIRKKGVEKIKEELQDEITEEQTDEYSENPSLDYLIEQLNKKDEQIEQLHKLIDQQQQLNAEDKKLIKELNKHLAIEAPKEENEAVDSEENEKEAKLAETLAENSKQLLALQERLQKMEQNQVEQEKVTEVQKKWYQFWK